MNRERLEEIRRRVGNATPGPWNVYHEFNIINCDRGICSTGIYSSNIRNEAPQNKVNAQFIAHARTDIPALLEYVDELEIKVKVRDCSLDRLDKKIGRILNRLP